jgi:hypothetical protein
MFCGGQSNLLGGPSVVDGEDMEASVIALVTLHVPRQSLPRLVPWESVPGWW